MSATVSCDYCGRTITENDRVLTLDLRSDSDWTLDFHAYDCFEQFQEIMAVVRERADFLGNIPVASEAQMSSLRPQNSGPIWDSYQGHGLPNAVVRALVDCGIDLPTALEMTDRHLGFVPGIGPAAIRRLRAIERDLKGAQG
jgi:hypothetical protein